jgi:hypothetical protein
MRGTFNRDPAGLSRPAKKAAQSHSLSALESLIPCGTILYCVRHIKDFVFTPGSHAQV